MSRNVRKRISATVRQATLLEAGYKCANPTCRQILTLEIHHIDWVRDGGGNDPSNLLALCPNCHTLHTNGHIPKTAIQAWKSLLVSLNNPHRTSADLLLVLYDTEQDIIETDPEKPRPWTFRFTGDGLGVLAGLITSGLISISRRFSGVSFVGGGMPSFEVELTPTGRDLVRAWRKGSKEELRDVLSKSKRPS